MEEQEARDQGMDRMKSCDVSVSRSKRKLGSVGASAVSFITGHKAFRTDHSVQQEAGIRDGGQHEGENAAPGPSPSPTVPAVKAGVSGLAWDQVDLFSGDCVSNFR